jgi:hypothetical protein
MRLDGISLGCHESSLRFAKRSNGATMLRSMFFLLPVFVGVAFSIVDRPHVRLDYEDDDVVA